MDFNFVKVCRNHIIIYPAFRLLLESLFKLFNENWLFFWYYDKVS